MQSSANQLRTDQSGALESSASAVSWGAIIGGAFVIAAVGLILLALGAGLGLSSVSPWPNSGASATTFGVAAAVWLIFVQWVSSAFGGYVTGRLRTKWTGVHTDEVYFRDTAHGFLAWAVAAVITAGLLSSAVSSLVSGASRVAGSVGSAAMQGAAQGTAQGAAQGGGVADPTGYLVDTLFRSDHPDANANPQAVRTETTRILLTDLRNGDVPQADRTYLAQLVAARTGLSQDDAQKRVDDVIAKAKDAANKAREDADKARKAAAYGSFFTAFAMVIGAFIAAAAGALGGHRRDELPTRY
ncbi:MAG: hypothetical protein JO267_07480 [Alphaproteobacteria bacterium]|nr:hypothetical protein [Alphaproteobacteria bacterium]